MTADEDTLETRRSRLARKVAAEERPEEAADEPRIRGLFAFEAVVPEEDDLEAVASMVRVLNDLRQLRLACRWFEEREDGIAVSVAGEVKVGFPEFTTRGGVRVAALQEHLGRAFGCVRGLRGIEPSLANRDDLALADLLAGPLSRAAKPIERRPLQDGAPAPRSAASLLDDLVGMEDVKRRLRDMAKFAAVKASRPEATPPMLHACFRGAPGTGKTTAARIYARMLSEAGALRKPDCFVEVDRADLVGEYVGHTAPKVRSVLKRARGGVLYIDEAYQLASSDGSPRDFGKEALSALVKGMEDERADVVVILSGYTKPMDDMISVNPGLRSRIGFYLDFPNYSGAELAQVVCRLAHAEGLDVRDDACEALEVALDKAAAHAGEEFGNARFACTVFERCEMRIAVDGLPLSITTEVVDAVFVDDDIAACVRGTSKVRVGFCAPAA